MKKYIKASYDAYTEDLADFGYREFDLAADLFAAYKNGGFPDDFDDDGVKLAFNKRSGYVFFTNSEYQVCMDVDGKLESFYNTPYSGYEGFYEDLVDEAVASWEDDASWDSEDIEYLIELAEARDDESTVEKLQALLIEKDSAE